MAKLTLVEEALDTEEEEDFYGLLLNQDPTNTSIDHKESFLWLINNSRKVSALYNKMRTQDIIADAVSVSKPGLFLDARVPDEVVQVFTKYSKVIRNKSKWAIPTIAEPFYLLGGHLFDVRANKNRLRAAPDRLAKMYKFVSSIVEEEEAIHVFYY